MIRTLIGFIPVLVLFCDFFILADDTPKQSASRDPGLRLELLRRTEIDQDARNAMTEWSKTFGTTSAVVTEKLSADQKAELEKIIAGVKRADEDNTQWLKEVIEKHGWPTITLVDKDGADAAWLLVQHADADPKFQRQCLDLMTLLPNEEVFKTKIAYLTDRVLLAEGKKQVYGTQFTAADGKWKPRPLVDEVNVDKRRAEVGLPPLAEYIKGLEEVYGPARKE